MRVYSVIRTPEEVRQEVRARGGAIMKIKFAREISIGYTPRARLLSDLATECRRHEVAKSLGNQARGVQPACTREVILFSEVIFYRVCI